FSFRGRQWRGSCRPSNPRPCRVCCVGGRGPSLRECRRTFCRFPLRLSWCRLPCPSCRFRQVSLPQSLPFLRPRTKTRTPSTRGSPRMRERQPTNEPASSWNSPIEGNEKHHPRGSEYLASGLLTDHYLAIGVPPKMGR